ncbi:MAG TPA: class I SAM-dependent methyltransferase [Chitinophagaceae bacterium]|jgi:2-polyprenyl-3-methyl-5-hydroxy-6-metoxy-1,4-benzoquinol methylase
MAIIHYPVCPGCGSPSIRQVLTAEDFTVSHQLFNIWECGGCSLRFTQDIPDAASIGQYYRSDAYVSHTDTKEGLVNRLYHFIRRRTLRQKCAFLRRQTGLTTGSLLDIGAGTGAFANTMHKAGWQVTALEPDSDTRQRAKATYGLELLPADGLLGLEAGSFDAITLWHVLEHVHELHRYIEQIKRLLKPGGCLFIAVPNYTSYDAGYYCQYWAAYDVPRHLYHFSPASMQRLLQPYQLRITDCKPMWFDSFYVSMLSWGYKNGKGNLLRAFWVGLVSNLRTMLKRQRCSSLIYIVNGE